MLNTTTWSAFRDQMPVCQKWSYFDHAAVGPLTLPARDTIQKWLIQATFEGDTVWPEWNRQVSATRLQFAEIINAKPSEVALIPNTTSGINLVAEGFPFAPGDNVVTLENEFPSNLYPWLNLESQGVETRRVKCDHGKVDLNRVIQSCDQRTRIVSLSWIGYASGYRIDVAEAAERIHQAGAFFFLDAIQGLGVFPIDVASCGVDFLAADGHKWMLGPEGAGFFFARADMLDRLRPRSVGWNSVKSSFDFSSHDLDLKADASRYEGGTLNQVGFMALGASLGLLREFGLSHQHSAIADQIIQTTTCAIERLEATGAELVFPRELGHESGILTFRVPGNAPEELRRRCLEQGVAVSCRGGGVRASFHGYNNEEDIQRLVDAVCTD